ncbi:MAG: transglutaminase-like putative cysteine protease [Pseudorhodobacter sp.]|jgi:transglutaminase-like putative cysteine protease
MRLTVDHITRYHYSSPVRGVVQSHRLTPSVFDGQRVLEWDVTVSEGIKGGAFRDGAGDLVQAWTVAGPVSNVTVSVRGVVETTDLTGILRGHKEKTPLQCYLQDTLPTRADVALAQLAQSAHGEEGTLDAAHRLAGAVSEAIAFAPGMTDANTTAAEALAKGQGVCQDHSHALIAAARFSGLPARYVSGYLHASQDGSLHEAAHAWAEIWIKDLGWVGFDAANSCCPDDRYIRLGSGLDAQDAAPIRGTSRGLGEETLDVAVAILQTDQ